MVETPKTTHRIRIHKNAGFSLKIGHILWNKTLFSHDLATAVLKQFKYNGILDKQQ